MRALTTLQKRERATWAAKALIEELSIMLGESDMPDGVTMYDVIGTFRINLANLNRHVQNFTAQALELEL